MEKIIFIGGIHGVGKGTLCEKIASQLDLTHLSSSKLIKWAEISSDKNKTVENIDETQNRLTSALNSFTKEKKEYLLDGHFCLLNSNNIPTVVPTETFIKINPIAIIIATEKEEIIQQRLKNRDNISNDLELLRKFQMKEIERGREIAKKMNIEIIISKGSLEEVILFIKDRL
jgi:adenylate kinase